MSTLEGPKLHNIQFSFGFFTEDCKQRVKYTDLQRELLCAIDHVPPKVRVQVFPGVVLAQQRIAYSVSQ